MESGEEGIDDEDGTEWKSSFTELQTNNNSSSPAACGANSISKTPHRVIVHFDLDCFYAQVEMLRNPALRNVPLVHGKYVFRCLALSIKGWIGGVQQKNIIVTCNYVARDHGVTKLMHVTDAKEKCPQLVMVKGEDLTHYRDMSYKVTDLLMSYCPLVERLGFDENFVDVTEMVDNRLMGMSESSRVCSFKGHVYNHAGEDVKASDDNPRLAVGSHVAAELRAAIHSKLGLTGCAGIATNKLLAKLVSGTFKPNQQTTLLPENLRDIMRCLSGLRKVPGVGHQTSKRLQALGLVSVQDLQLCPMTDLVREFGAPSAQRLQNLALGVDDSPVTPTGPPQSLSDEDSFKKMSSTKEVSQKIRALLGSLAERMHKDGRQPQTFRLTIRRYSATNKWFSRESRQCPIPNHVGQKITSGSTDALAPLVTMAMKLFHKMVDVGTAAFHLTLINVCFSNLRPRVDGAASIMSFFTSPGKTRSSSQNQSDLSPSGNSHSRHHHHHHGSGRDLEEQSSSEEDMSAQDALQSTALPESSPPPSANGKLQGLSSTDQGRLVVPLCQQEEVTPLDEKSMKSNSTEEELRCRLPPDVDPEVFRLLPEDIQKELLSPAYTNSLRRDLPMSTVGEQTTATTGATSATTTRQDLLKKNAPQQRPADYDPIPLEHHASHHFKDGKQATTGFVDSCEKATSARRRQLPPPGPSTSLSAGAAVTSQSRTSTESQSSNDCGFPADVDPTVFSELPPDVQRELMSEWKQQRPALKTLPASSSKKQGRNCLSKDDRKAAAHKGSQANSLLNYFKPN